MNERVIDEIETKEDVIEELGTGDSEPVQEFEYKVSKAQVRAVLRLIEQGHSKRSACREVGINRSSFELAVARIGAANQYARASISLAEEQVAGIENVIDDMRSGKITPEIGRLELDARKWLASKLLPKKYGDKVEHEQNINVSFMNGVPRPKTIEVDAISSVPKQIAPSTDPS